MTYQAKTLKAAARNTNLPKTDKYGAATYSVRTESKRVTHNGKTYNEYGNAVLHIHGYYDVDFAVQVARDLVAQVDCYVFLNLNKHGQVSITATTGRKEITLVDPYTQTKHGTATFTDIAIA